MTVEVEAAVSGSGGMRCGSRAWQRRVLEERRIEINMWA
jgi:hypothetical protein